MKKISFEDAVAVTQKIITRFEKIEGKPWGATGTMIEMQKQVGELSKLIMVKEGFYFKERGKQDSQYLSTKEKIADELADILYAVIRMAKHYNIDLLEAHLKEREKEDAFLKTKNV